MSSEELAEWEKSFDQGRGPYGLLVKNTAIRIGPIQLIKTRLLIPGPSRVSMNWHIGGFSTSATESEAFTRRINSDH
jgi:hypothetical protein